MMELTEKELKKLKEIELDIFAKFILVCEKLGLKYYLLGGTLLGAVRHKGFIPWDDDIDVGMPREDYEKFIAEGQAFLPKEYFIQSFRTDPDFPANFAKIRNSNTTFWETSVRNSNINHGIFIDIFPLDYYPEDKRKQKKIKFMKKWLTLRIASVFYFADRKESFRIKIARAMLSIIYPSYKSAVRAREKLYKSSTKDKYIANHSGAWGVKEIVPAEWYGEGCLLEFEGLSVVGPAQYDKWLTQVYGDYMTLPPMDKRVAHHYVDVMDTEKSYKEYLDKERRI